MSVRFFNGALFIVRKVQKNPGKYTLPELTAMIGRQRKNYTYLLDTGVLVYAAKQKSTGKPGRVPMTLRLGRIGREKLAAHQSGASMASL